MASGYRSGDSADAATARAGKGAVLCTEKKTTGTGLELVVKPGEGTSKKAFSEPRLDHLIEELHRHSHDPDALRCAAGAMRRTVETSLWQSAHGTGSRLPEIHAGLLGPAAEIFATEKLLRLSWTFKQWLVLLSSPQRILWAVHAAWKGEAVIAYVSERASWHSVPTLLFNSIGFGYCHNSAESLAQTPLRRGGNYGVKCSFLVQTTARFDGTSSFKSKNRSDVSLIGRAHV